MADFANPHYKSMYNHFVYGGGYNLDGDAFDSARSTDLIDDITTKTGLRQGSLGDWWVHPDDNPEMTWNELIDLALNILSCESTRVFVHNLHLEHVPSFECKTDYELKSRSVSGAKRVNADAGEYYDVSGAVGIAGLMNPNRDDIMKNPLKRDSGDRFRLSGKDESCCVEGTWYDWVCFACNILASENTKEACPDLYEPKLKNENY